MTPYPTYCITAVVLLLGGCAIEPSSSGGAGMGTLYITATDGAGTPVEGAAITVDRSPTGELTPSHIALIAGNHEVIAAKFGYFADTAEVEVFGNDTASLELTLPEIPPDQVGFLSVTSQPDGARLLVDGRTYSPGGDTVRTPAVVSLPWGMYRVSVHLPGYATGGLMLPQVPLAAGDTAALDFTLSPGETIEQPGGLPVDFTLETLTGDSITLSDLTGYVVLVNFWYVDCPPCRAEFPGIEAVYQRHHDGDFRVVALNPMVRDTPDDLTAFRAEFGLTFPLLLDYGMRVTSDYNVSAFPKNVLIDRSGRIDRVWNAVEEQDLETRVGELLGP